MFNRRAEKPVRKPIIILNKIQLIEGVSVIDQGLQQLPSGVYFINLQLPNKNKHYIEKLMIINP